MKRLCCFLFVAIFFASYSSFGLVRIKPKTDTVLIQKQYSAEETAAANLVEKANKINNLKNPHRIFPNQTLAYPFPGDNDRLDVLVEKGDYQLKIAKKINAGGYGVATPEPEKEKIVKDLDGEVVFTLPEEKPFDYSWLFWLALICCGALLFALIRSLMKNSDIQAQYQAGVQDLRGINRSLEKELENTKNKLPIEAPEVADEKWLRDNSPLEHSNYVLGSTIVPPLSDSTITRVFGKKPDLIATAIVSTKPKSISMEFSHQRKALTGLKDAAVHIGWNWNDETKDWTEVGMVASVCSNGFEMNPEQIVKTDDLFTKIGVVSKERRPVTFVADRVPFDAPYPSLLKTLMIEFHQDNIADLKKSGLTFEDLNKKTKKVKK